GVPCQGDRIGSRGTGSGGTGSGGTGPVGPEGGLHRLEKGLRGPQGRCHQFPGNRVKVAAVGALTVGTAVGTVAVTPVITVPVTAAVTVAVTIVVVLPVSAGIPPVRGGVHV